MGHDLTYTQHTTAHVPVILFFTRTLTRLVNLLPHCFQVLGSAQLSLVPHTAHLERQHRTRCTWRTTAISGALYARDYS